MFAEFDPRAEACRVDTHFDCGFAHAIESIPTCLSGRAFINEISKY